MATPSTPDVPAAATASAPPAPAAAASSSSSSSSSSTPTSTSTSTSTASAADLLEKFSSASFAPVAASGFRGIINQGATCYLNSLVQTLFMTPEIRSAIYDWRFDSRGGAAKGEFSIALQLQRLFARLQISDAAAVSTEGLTTSFGWGRAHVFEQQDVQEFIQKLYEMIEKTCAGTPLAATWSELNYGVTCDSIECRVCKSVRGKDEAYMNISLQVKDMKSVSDSFANFIKPSIMEGDNCIYCAKCGKKAPAEKGYKFRTFPYLLALQLKRFDMNWATMQRLKINSHLPFPRTLDVASLLAWTRDVGAAASDDTNYELFSILIHTGSAVGGHYYSYTKDMSTGKWYEFNDTTVKELSPEELQAIFGNEEKKEEAKAPAPSGSAPGAPPAPGETPAAAAPPSPDAPTPPVEPTPTALPFLAGYGPPPPTPPSAPINSPSANAYMLMYRRIQPAKNLGAVDASRIPAEIRAEIDAENTSFRVAKAEYTRLQGLSHFLVHYGPPTAQVEVKVTLERATSRLADVIQGAYDQLGLASRSVALENLRLRDWDDSKKKATHPIKGNDLLAFYQFPSAKDVYLEEKAVGGAFEEYSGERLTLALIQQDTKTQEFLAPVLVPLLETQTLHDLRVAAAKTFGFSGPADVRLVMQLDDSRVDSLVELQGRETITLAMGLQLKNNDKIYVEPAGTGESVIIQRFKFLAYQVTVRFNLLTDKKAVAAAAAGGAAASEVKEVKAAKAGADKKELKTDFAVGSLTIDERLTLGQLKSEIAAKHGFPLSMDNFRILKAAGEPELKDLTKQLGMYHIRDLGSVWLEYGTPMRPGDCLTRISLHVPPSEQQRVRVLIQQRSLGLNELKQPTWRVWLSLPGAGEVGGGRGATGDLGDYLRSVSWEWNIFNPVTGEPEIQNQIVSHDSKHGFAITGWGLGELKEVNASLQPNAAIPPAIFTMAVPGTSPPPATFTPTEPGDLPPIPILFDIPRISVAAPTSAPAAATAPAAAPSEPTADPMSMASPWGFISAPKDPSPVYVPPPPPPPPAAALPGMKDIFIAVGEMILAEDWNYEQVTDAIARLPGAPPARLQRLRECLNGQLTRFYLPTNTLKKNCPGLKDGTEIFVQALEVEEKLTLDHLLIYVQQWTPAAMQLSFAKEIPMLKTMKINELKTLLAGRLGSHVRPEDVLVVPPRPDELKDITRIPGLAWTNPRLRSIDTIGGSPWRLRPGDYILFMEKNSGKVGSAISTDDVKSRSALFNMSRAAPSGDGARARGGVPLRTEAALTIYTQEEIEKRAAEAKAVDDAMRESLLAAGIDLAEASAAAQAHQDNKDASTAVKAAKAAIPHFEVRAKINEDFFG